MKTRRASNSKVKANTHEGWHMIIHVVLMACITILLLLHDFGARGSMRVVETIVMVVSTLVGVAMLITFVAENLIKIERHRQITFQYVTDWWCVVVVLPLSFVGLIWGNLRSISILADILLLLWALEYSYSEYYRKRHDERKRSTAGQQACPEKIEGSHRRSR